MRKLRVCLGDRGYDITVGSGALDRVGELFNLDRKVFILTDSGVPKEYSERVRVAAKNATVYTVQSGEGSKSIEVFGKVLEGMLNFGLTRSDAVVAVGGGVIGDLGGFAAASYMRGIDFYNIPTTVLSQVDSSIGGKTAVNLAGVKNVVGAFYQPKGVIIDTDTLKTLPKRHFSAGMCEAVKMSLTSDGELFRIFETEDANEKTEEIIYRSLTVKKGVVEKDERESGLRKILNFGHTLGHGIEAEEGMSGLYHGECVAIGMIPMCATDVRERLVRVLKKLELPCEYHGDLESALRYVVHDKKCKGETLEAILVNEIGSFEIKKVGIDEFKSVVKEVLN